MRYGARLTISKDGTVCVAQKVQRDADTAPYVIDTNDRGNAICAWPNIAADAAILHLPG